MIKLLNAWWEFFKELGHNISDGFVQVFLPLFFRWCLICAVFFVVFLVLMNLVVWPIQAWYKRKRAAKNVAQRDQKGGEEDVEDESDRQDDLGFPV